MHWLVHIGSVDSVIVGVRDNVVNEDGGLIQSDGRPFICMVLQYT